MWLLSVRCFLALAIGSWVASQLFAFQIGYSESLGSGLYTTYGIVFYAPYAVGVWLWHWPSLITSHQMWQALVVGLALTGIGVLWACLNHHADVALSSHGTSRWASVQEVKRLGQSS